MKSVTKLIAYAIIVGAAIIAATLAAAGVLVCAEFAPQPNDPSGLLSMFLALISLPAMLFVPAVAALATSYILHELFRRRGWVSHRGRWVTLLLAGLAPLMACSVFFAYIFYTSEPTPLPTPYPGATVKEVWKEIGHGHYDTHIYEYTTDAPLTELERHYQIEMPQYCTDEWQFSPTKIACQDYALCLVAECEIPRPLVKEPQLFTVYLRSISETQTNVQYHIRSEGSF